MQLRPIVLDEHQTTRVWALAAALLPDHGGDLNAALVTAVGLYQGTMATLERGPGLPMETADGPVVRLTSRLDRLCLEPPGQE